MRRFILGSAIAASLALAGCATPAQEPPASDAAFSAEAPPAAPAPASAPEATKPPVSGDSPDPAEIRRVPQPVDAPDPTGVTIPGIGAIPIVPVGVAEDGQAEIPENVAEVGWYEYGSAPGENDGSVVVMGHRDSRGGKGALFSLPNVPVGTVVDVVDAAGVSHQYRVVRNESISKQVVPLADLFTRDGPKQLTLISCGGPYIADQGGYLDNVVVTAVPV